MSVGETKKVFEESRMSCEKYLQDMDIKLASINIHGPVNIIEYNKDAHEKELRYTSYKIFGGGRNRPDLHVKYVAVVDSMLVGYICWQKYSYEDNETYVYLHDLGTYIQNRGIGTMLVQKMFECVADGMRIEVLPGSRNHIDKLIVFYERNGFKKIEDKCCYFIINKKC